jgi:2,4-dienoyl-CoA reductase-like NADH-dependent reductase (Old Yellow Enzyme family)/pyruvate/2-oxoglutarate dehydrogenase complex dihydrolipoamide dehydrogenase (E3) component
MDHFPHLFKPIKIGSKTLKHRLNFGAHTTNMSDDGIPGERHLHYYLERAIGGAAMIVVEPVPVHRTAVLTRGNFRPEDDGIIPHFRRITEACHEHGTVMIQQLYHVGAHGDWDNSFEPNWSPSGVPSMHDGDGSHAMNQQEIKEIVESFAQGARRAKESGFDGCELMASYNALIEQFWSPYSNHRTDRYGGSFENRMRFSAQLLSRMREVGGDEFIIGMAISVDTDFPEVLSLEDQQEIARYHDERGLYDYITVGSGSYFNFPPIIPTAVHADKLGAPLSEGIKEAVRHAKVQAESHIRTPENADYVIASGQADMVSIVRGQIADPHLANKARDGNAEDIRPCISCNQMCWGRRHRDYWISCLINPSAGREFRWGGDRFERTNTSRKILVIGGGPAGLEVARVAAERGHHVTLVEASDKLGGQFRLAGMQPRRSQILDLLEWYERQLKKLGVSVQYNSFVESKEVLADDADAVVLATGSLPSNTGFQRGLPTRHVLSGVDRPNVWSIEDVMNRSAKLGKKVLLLDDTGTWRGVGTAWYMAEREHQVTIVTSDPYVGQGITRTATDIPLRKRLRTLGVQFIMESAVDEWLGDAALIVDLTSGEKQKISFDTLVLSTPNKPFNNLEQELRNSTKEFYLIGDCVAARQAYAAIFEGRRLGLEL